VTPSYENCQAQNESALNSNPYVGLKWHRLSLCRWNLAKLNRHSETESLHSSGRPVYKGAIGEVNKTETRFE